MKYLLLKHEYLKHFLFAATFDDDFYISSSNQPFETNTSQFFPGQKSSDISDTFEPHASDLTPLKPKNLCMYLKMLAKLCKLFSIGF